MKAGARLFKEAFVAWTRSKTPRLGAALAYYAVFAIAPLFLIAMSIASFWFGKDQARQQLFREMNTLVGQSGAQAIQSMVVSAASRPHAGLWATLGALASFGAGVTAVFVELQDALNTIWGVQRKSGGGAWSFIKDRLLSFALVLGIGFLLLASLVLDVVLAALGKFASGSLPEQHLLWAILNFLVSLGIITLLFAMILKVLPDVCIDWQDVWVGAFVTALLFNLGKFLIGYYVGRSSMISIYGAAGSIIILLLWVYYSAQILFFGAEFTRLRAAQRAQSRGQTTTPPVSLSSERRSKV